MTPPNGVPARKDDSWRDQHARQSEREPERTDYLDEGAWVEWVAGGLICVLLALLAAWGHSLVSYSIY